MPMEDTGLVLMTKRHTTVSLTKGEREGDGREEAIIQIVIYYNTC